MISWWAVIGLVMAAIPMDTPTPVPFIHAVDWALVLTVGAFGILGAIPRLDPRHASSAVWQQISSGCVGGMVCGLWAADMDIFRTAPRSILVIALAAGYGGSAILDGALRMLRGRMESDPR